jgi:hypothetical protein
MRRHSDCLLQAVVNCAREMENFFDREGPHGAAGIPYCRIEVDDKASFSFVFIRLVVIAGRA